MKPFTAITGLWFSLMFVGALSMTACSKDKGEQRQAARQSVTGQPMSPTNPGGFQAMSTYLSANQQRVSDMVSAQWDPQGLGQIDNDSVILAGYIEASTNGQVNASTSKIQIWINDSYAKESNQSGDGETYEPYYISIGGQSVTGTVNASQVNVVFSDKYRQITISGSYNAQNFTGTVNVRNLQDFDGGAPRNPGVIGNFSVPTCGMMNCRRM